ncbi:hypothetical protein BHE74_00028558 [Ensete ventricosum]|nr:hypothetical protein BHE74_00028558 [Ensete ventricosum]
MHAIRGFIEGGGVESESNNFVTLLPLPLRSTHVGPAMVFGLPTDGEHLSLFILTWFYIIENAGGDWLDLIFLVWSDGTKPRGAARWGGGEKKSRKANVWNGMEQKEQIKKNDNEREKDRSGLLADWL